MDDYYSLLGATLRFKPTSETLPDFEKFMVDEAKRTVSIVMEGGFESLATGKGWVEKFVYVVEFGRGWGERGKGDGERKIERLD
ncbi:MAG: hypothetical protein Q9221_008906, partial [Calogaya cf. arnoldii]